MNYTRCLLLLFSMMSFFSCKQEKYDITFSSLLDEMVDYEESARFPAIPFSCRQESSYDRRSVHPDSAGWFANNDGFGIIRVDTIIYSICNRLLLNILQVISQKYGLNL